MNQLIFILYKKRYILEQWEDGTLPCPLVKQMRILWSDAGIKASFKRSNEYQLNDSAGHFLDALDRVAVDGYVPTEQDVLRTRARTTGIVEVQFRHKVHSYMKHYQLNCMSQR